MKECSICGSMQFNKNARTDNKYDFLCDVHYWRHKAEMRGKALVIALDGSNPILLCKDNGRSLDDCIIAFEVYDDALDDNL